MSKKEEKILSYIKAYQELVENARKDKFLQTKSFVGDMVESLVCEKLGAKRAAPSQKGFDAVRGEDLIQI